MDLTFIDGGVLIAALKGHGQTSQTAAKILADRTRQFASSDFVRLEVLLKPIYFGRAWEVAFYESFFSAVTSWATLDLMLTQEAFRIGSSLGLSGMDALHIAAALRVGADELVTSEKLTKPIHRVQGIRVVTIQP